MSGVDLFCLVADRNMEAAISGLLERHPSLGIRQIRYRVATHPRQDPGCFHTGAEFLKTVRHNADHALGGC